MRQKSRRALWSVYAIPVASSAHSSPGSFPPIAMEMELQCNERAKADSKLRGNGEQILVVEDNPNLRELLASVLEAFNYRVLTAFSAETALDLWKNKRGPIPVLLADFMLPTTNGMILARELQRESPELKVIFTSGELRVETIQGTIPDSWAFLAKPFSHVAILRKIKQALEPGSYAGE